MKYILRFIIVYNHSNIAMWWFLLISLFLNIFICRKICQYILKVCRYMHTCIGILYNENNSLVYMLCYTRGCWKVISPTHFFKKSEQILEFCVKGFLVGLKTFQHPFVYVALSVCHFFYPFYFNWNVLEIFLKNSYFICDQYWWLKYENNSLLNLWFVVDISSETDHCPLSCTLILPWALNVL